MKEWLWHLKCMWWSRKQRTEQESIDYAWYKYLVLFPIKRFFERRKPENQLPF